VKGLSISKEQINRLPLGEFNGAIHVADDPVSLEAACRRLRDLLDRETPRGGQRLLGFDTESRPSFQKGERHPICLIQLAATKEAFLFRVRPPAAPACLRELLEDPATVKIGLAAPQELNDLARDLGVRGQGFLDLLGIAERLGCQPKSLRALAALFLGIRVSKAMQRANWARRQLSERQLRYAATDAWACLEVHRVMRRRRLLARRERTIGYQEPRPSPRPGPSPGRHPSSGPRASPQPRAPRPSRGGRADEPRRSRRPPRAPRRSRRRP
jgi:ribonuclease D